MTLLIIGLIGCGSDPVVKGKVLDIWNKPIADAMIQLEGNPESQHSDSNGNFSFVLQSETDKNLRFRAGSEGYIHDVEILVYSSGTPEDQMPSVTFNLYPEPETKGFYAVGESSYIPLDGQNTLRVSTQLEAYHGIGDVGQAAIQTKGKQQFVFHSSLRKEQIKQIDLTLSLIEFKEHEDVKGVLGETPIEIDLWLAKGNPMPFGLRSLDQDHMYLIEFPDQLATGMYAFHSGNYLTKADPRKPDTLPEELKVAYPFEVK